jgi:hypothetical protein
MMLVAIAWIWVVLMMALAEAVSPQGSVLGALITFVLYGVAPLALVLYLMATPMRRRRLRAADEASRSAAQTPDGGGHAAAVSVAPVREEP